MHRNTSVRIEAIDIMRGLTLFLMLFVNDLFEPGVPHWMVHADANADSMGLADWVFPGFLFMVGLSIPFAFANRRKKGDTTFTMLMHILIRTVSLLVIGILIYNGEERLSTDLTGMDKLVWLFLLYLSVFLVWNWYPKQSRYAKWFVVLRCLGGIGLLWLCWVFKAGAPGDVSWLRPGWWGILGLIGWGYLVAALAYMISGKKLLYCFLLWLIFIFLNCFSVKGGLDFLAPLSPVLGVITDGNVPSIVIAGLLIGMVLHKRWFTPWQFVVGLFALGIICIGIGLVLRHWFILSKIIGTPSWGMLCNGISMALFALIYALSDIAGKSGWAYLFKLAGRNSLTTYLSPDMIYFASWYFGWPLFFYKQDQHAWLAIVGSLIWAGLMVIYAWLLSRCHIKLKL
ncbi:MAG TPA: DUF5009 domain-containing protein [Arachidicoccus sp.]|nr:DUF5009 domain-containing protein [Arachidicoccus sp.]